MGPVTPRLRSAPRTNVVLPAPSSPETSTTSPGFRRAASSAPAASVASGPLVSTKPGAKRQAGAQQQRSAGGGQPVLKTRVRQARARGRGRRGGAGLTRSRRGRGLGGRGSRRCRGGGGARGRGRRRLFLVGPRGIRVLVVAGALCEGVGGSQREGGCAYGKPSPESRSERHERASVDRGMYYGHDRMRHILLLTDHDWTHPQGGGTGANLFGQVAFWLQWGHRVTVVAGTYPGAERVARPAEGLELHHMGSRRTVFARAAWAVSRGLARDADVVLEVVNGITFLTPLWLRKPRVTLIHHIHRDHYVTELGRVGAVAAVALETLPLKLLYGGAPFLTISQAAADDIAGLGIDPSDVTVGYLGVVPFPESAARSESPRLLYLGRLKRYKRIELLLDVVEGVPGTVLDIAGEGDHRPHLEAEIARRGLGERVLLHGHVSEAEKAQLYSRAWVNLTASSAEGWCLTVMEAATCGTPSAALRVGGLPESIVDGETGLLADDGPELVAAVSRLVADDDLRARMGRAAQERAASFTWERTARESLDLLAK